MTGGQGFAAVPTWMIRDSSIRRSAVLVYASLASRSGYGAIFPSQETIAEESGCSVRTVRTALQELEELGVVQRTSRRKAGGKANAQTTAYTIHPNGHAAIVADPSERPEEAIGNQAHPIPLIEIENRDRENTPRPKKVKAHALPEEWSPTPEHRAKAAERGVDVAVEAEAFRLHAEANGRLAVKWNAAFSQWLLRARPSQPVASASGGYRPGDEWMGMTR